MRKTHKFQPNLQENWLDVHHAKELQKISRLLDDHPKLAELVLQDLLSVSGAEHDRGAGGLSSEQVLRSLIIKQMNSFSYRTLAFHLADSIC